MYQSNLKADEWARIEGYFEPQDKRGCKPEHSKKEIVDAILYIVHREKRLPVADVAQGFSALENRVWSL